MPVIFPPSDLSEAATPSTRQLLCEGYDESLVVESAYVRQGKKVWKSFGDCLSLTSLCESETDIVLVESLELLEVVQEADGRQAVKDGVWIVEGPAQRSDVENKNKRKYPRAIWEKWIADPKSPLQETIKARGAIGHLEHPKDGRTDGNQGAMVVTEATLRKDGVVWGKFEVLDTPPGKIIQEYIKKKVRWGVSSRGAGTVNESGVVSIVDYVPETWDAVMRPSTPGAFPLPEAKKAAKKAAVTEEETTGAAGSPKVPMTDVTKVFTDRLNAINRKVETVDECAKSASAAETLLADITEAVVKGGQDIASGAPLILSSAKVLRESFDALAAIQVVEHADDGEQAGAGTFNTVVATLRKQVKESVSEIAELQCKVEQAESRVDAYATARHKAVEEAEALTEQAGALKVKLDNACATISDLSESTVTNPIQEALDMLVTKYPVLKDYAAPLGELPDLVALVEEAVPILLREGRPVGSQAPQKSATPVGLLLESEAVFAPTRQWTTVSPNISAQVGLAAAVVGRTAPKQ